MIKLFFSLFFLGLNFIFFIPTYETKLNDSLELDQLNKTAYELALSNYLFKEHADSDLIYQGYKNELEQKTHIIYKFYIKQDSYLSTDVVAIILEYTFLQEKIYTNINKITRNPFYY